MIKDKLKNIHRYAINEEFESLKKEVGTGRNLLLKNHISIKAIHLNYFTDDLNYEKFESHKKYIDVHVMIKGSEKIGSNHEEELTALVGYDEVQDYQLFKGTSKEELVVDKDEFIIFFPGEAHLTGGKINESEEIIKMVYKVPVG